MSRQKDVLTTGEVAKICSVAPRTVSKWFDSGQLRGYRIPGSKDRRIPISSLTRFMQQHNIPLDGLMSGQTRVLIVDSDPDIIETLTKALVEGANYEVKAVTSGFAAGLECEKFRPHVMLLDVHLSDLNSKDILNHVRESEDLESTRVIATSSRLTDGQMQQMISQGYDSCLRKPFTIREAVEAIEESVAVVY